MATGDLPLASGEIRIPDVPVAHHLHSAHRSLQARRCVTRVREGPPEAFAASLAVAHSQAAAVPLAALTHHRLPPLPQEAVRGRVRHAGADPHDPAGQQCPAPPLRRPPGARAWAGRMGRPHPWREGPWGQERLANKGRPALTSWDRD